MTVQNLIQPGFYEFIKFYETPKEQKMIGFAMLRHTTTSLIDNKPMLDISHYCYKFMRNEKQGGYFIQPPSVKADSDPGENNFVNCIAKDSTFIKEYIEGLLKEGYKQYLSDKQQKSKPFVDTKKQTANVEDEELPF